MSPFTEADELECEMELAWQVFIDQHPYAGETHERTFRFSYAKAWEDCERYWKLQYGRDLNAN